MSSLLLPLRRVIKESMASWCALAGVPVDLAEVPVTDLAGRRANRLRAALRDTEDAVRRAHDAALRARLRADTEHRALHTRALDALDVAIAAAAEAAGPTASMVDRVHDHPLVGRVWRITRMCVDIASVTNAEGMAALVEQTEALAADLTGARA